MANHENETMIFLYEKARILRDMALTHRSLAPELLELARELERRAAELDGGDDPATPR